MVLLPFSALCSDKLPELLRNSGGYYPPVSTPYWDRDGSSFWFFDQVSYTFKYYDHSSKDTVVVIDTDKLRKLSEMTGLNSLYRTGLATKFLSSKFIEIKSKSSEIFYFDIENIDLVSKEEIDPSLFPKVTTPDVSAYSPDGRHKVFSTAGELKHAFDIDTNREKVISVGLEGNVQVRDLNWQVDNTLWSDDSSKFIIYGDDLDIYRKIDVNQEESVIRNFDAPVKSDQLLLVDIVSKKVIDLHLDAFSGETREIQLIGQKGSSFIVSVVNELQNQKVYYKISDRGVIKEWFRDESTTFLSDYLLSNRVTNLFITPEGHDDLYISDKSGVQQIYKVDEEGQISQIFHTNGNIDQIIDYDPNRKSLIFTSYMVEKNNPYHLHILKYEDGKVKRITRGKRNYGEPKMGRKFRFSHSRKGYFDISPSREVIFSVNSSMTKPHSVQVINVNGDAAVNLFNTETKNLFSKGYRVPELFDFDLSDGNKVFGTIFKPRDFDPDKKYPIIEIVYGGPQTINVDYTFASYYQRMANELANKGYVIVMMDTPGTPYRGKDFHTKNFKKFGQVMVQDHAEVIKGLGSRYPWLDASNVTVWGASFGGHQALNFGARRPDVYKTVISESATFDLKYLNSTSIIPQMHTPKMNESGYENFMNEDLLRNLSDVELFFIHGKDDRNTPYEELVLFQSKLNELNVDYTEYIYENMDHFYDERKLHAFFKIISRKSSLEEVNCNKAISRLVE